MPLEKHNSNSRRIKCIIAYDGSAFCGWQSQIKDRTVQDTLEAALAEVTGTRIKITGAGRTDAGVHARGQVAHFDTDHPSIPDFKFKDALNSILPPDVRILESAAVPDTFHSRFSAKMRTYRYYIDCSLNPQPSGRLYSWQIRRYLPVRRLNDFSLLVAGEHDFTSFSRAADPSPSKIKTVSAACFFPVNGMIVFEISAQSFLWMMVRTIVGTIVDCVSAGQTEADFLAILNEKKRDSAGKTAPPQGLFLERILYEK
ncbi:MAG: tRNA pseudouridine(38-40) synthase TruA [Spirochaetales bacterium]|nr:tRNA pseudouridine(38-40) synthase TruA [Spirochaetales bacterium]